MEDFREEIRQETKDALKKKADSDTKKFGYGGKFGVQNDRMDKSAVGHDYQTPLQKHASQKDYATGFGGKFGVQNDRKDKSAVGWDHVEKVEKHDSQKGTLDLDKILTCLFLCILLLIVKVLCCNVLLQNRAVTDYKTGFGGQFGVQTDRVDKSAAGWDHVEKVEKHASQKGNNSLRFPSRENVTISLHYRSSKHLALKELQ